MHCTYAYVAVFCRDISGFGRQRSDFSQTMDAGHCGLFPCTLNKSKPKDLLNSAPLWLCGVNKVQPKPLELKCALEFLWTKKVDGIDVGDGFQDER